MAGGKVLQVGDGKQQVQESTFIMLSSKLTMAGGKVLQVGDGKKQDQESTFIMLSSKREKKLRLKGLRSSLVILHISLNFLKSRRSPLVAPIED